ncbi:antibiotic biosynthesis monooxygenase [Motilibacter peucedani]|uniref:Antibiotic biosynthesis monooxygenase n=1 Tax=Motilibacter peucedani TaxID=598650 RepID=A0A420XSX5_9ACTN|nr:antibiotic biosynthesis monooxygenase [Motilibacter peucedani]RKS79914.1 antibiotic biosynthesis monooxygenase [Motilibacter peucedani]
MSAPEPTTPTSRSDTTTSQERSTKHLLVTSVFTLLDEPDSSRESQPEGAPTPDRQQRLFTLLCANAHDVLERSPGFLGSELTCSEDGRHIVHHARWANPGALASMLASPGARAGMQAVRSLATVQVLRSRAYRQFTAAADPSNHAG